MTDYQQIVDEIRFALQSEDCELTESLRQANQDYTIACQEVNQQLRKIAGYLDNGLRSEAIQLAEGPPNLLESARILNFPEVTEWADVVALYDLPRSEPLMLGVVEQLNDALVVDQPLQKLMGRHRRLALIRAPLRMRLAVLRELLTADPETPCWEEDIRTFEKARFTEMTASARDAQRSGDISLLKQLQADFSTDDWLEEPPAKLVAGVRRSVGELSRKTARSEINGIVADLESAFSELDLPRAREARSRWQAARKRAALSASDPLLSQLEPVLGWIQDEDALEAADQKYARTIAEFESALDSETNLEQLDRLAHEIKRLDRELPDLIATRYRNRREALLLAQSRLHRLQIGSAAAVLLVVVGFVGFLIQRQQRASEVQRVASHVAKLLENRQWKQARQALQQRKDITRWDGLMALQTRLDEEQHADEERRKHLKADLDEAGAATTYAEAMAALDHAKAYAQSGDEEAELESSRRSWEMRNNQELAEREKKLKEGIQSVAMALVEADRSMGTGPGDEQIAESLSQAKVSLANLKVQAHGLRPEVLSQIALLASRQKELTELRTRRLLLISREEELTHQALVPSQVRNPAAAIADYRTALLAYADALGMDSAAEPLQESANEDHFWRGVLEWSRVSQAWSDVWPNDSAKTQARLQEVDKFLKSHAGSPDAKTIELYRSQLNAVLVRDGLVGEFDNGLKPRLRRIYSTPLIAQSWCLKTEDGKVFYLPEEEKLLPGKLVSFPYYIGYGKEDTQTQKRLKEADFSAHVATPSPSSQIAAFVKENIDSANGENWNDFLLQLSLQLQESRDLDPFLKLDLLKRTLEAAADGDVFLKEKLSLHLKRMQELSINPLARWMDPDDEEGTKAREESQRVLAQLEAVPFENLKEIWQEADVARAAFTAQFNHPPIMIGWLKHVGGKWNCVTEWTADGPHTLQVVFVGEKSSLSQWRNIGEMNSESLKIKPGVNAFLAAGRAVFAVPQSQQVLAGH